MSKPVISEYEIGNITIKDCHKKTNLNFTDIIKNSNKTYNIELLETNDGKFYLYSLWGRTGSSLTKEYRACSDKYDAEKEFDKIIKSKEKKGYQKIALLKSEIGSELGKAKIEASLISEEVAKKAGYTIKEENKSSLHPAIQSVVKTWFGSMEQFVIDTLDTSKCALGSLSLDQINKGRDLLLDARQLVAAGAKDITELNNISSKYYSNIPMNFGFKRLDADALRFDNDEKLDKAFDILDTLEGVKDAEKILTKKNAIDEQYNSLKTPMDWIDPKEDVFKWIDILVNKTRASNHSYLGKIKVSNIFKLERPKEQEEFLAKAEKIAQLGQKRESLPEVFKPIWEKRIKDKSDYEKLCEQANILPLFHGSINPNYEKILKSKLRLPRAGFSISGAMFSKDPGLYFASNSTKSLQYSSLKHALYSKGSSDKGFLFLCNVALGQSELATKAYPYTINGIKPKSSVYAKSGTSVINDEFITFYEDQSWIRYIIEIESI